MQLTSANFPATRLRRLRYHPKMRNLVRENSISVNDLVLPLFIRHGKEIKQPINSMPSHFQLSVDKLAQEIEEIVSLKIPAVMLFGIPAHKDASGTDALHEYGIIQQAIALIKDIAPDLLVMSDLCFCEYTDHGHCGIINDRMGWLDVDNDATLRILVEQAISHAQAGVDVLVPSGMIDGAVTNIRQALDEAGYNNIPILHHTAKYASSLYGPFREAAEGAPQFGDRKTYQMDPANSEEAMREAMLDINEGADILMIKPAGMYLDVISNMKQQFPYMPLAAYQVSGEFAMIKAASLNGWIDEKNAALESLIAIKRAGADILITYFAKDVARWLKETVD